MIILCKLNNNIVNIIKIKFYNLIAIKEDIFICLLK